MSQKINIASIILAAGKGTRMNSDLPKVLFEVNGKPMVHYVVELAANFSTKIIVVVGYKREVVKDSLSKYQVDFVEQEEQLGTGHAVNLTNKVLNLYSGYILILYGDIPLLSKATIQSLINEIKDQNVKGVVLTADVENPFKYGRVIRDKDNFISKIVEEKDATEEEKKIKEINSGIYIFEKESLFTALSMIKNDNAQNELYLTDVVVILNALGEKVIAHKIENSYEIYGVNTPQQLEIVNKLISGKDFITKENLK